MKKDKRVLVTGFEPFDGDAVNPSQVLLNYLREHPFDFHLHTQVLPVSFTRAMPLLDQAILHIKPTHVVMTGYAHKREVLTIEQVGLNLIDARIPDNDGLTLKNRPISADGPEKLFSTIPVEKLVQASLDASVACNVSTNAGEYVCNHILYSYLSAYKDIPGTFIHIPRADDHGPFFRGIKAIIHSL